MMPSTASPRPRPPMEGKARVGSPGKPWPKRGVLTALSALKVFSSELQEVGKGSNRCSSAMHKEDDCFKEAPRFSTSTDQARCHPRAVANVNYGPRLKLNQLIGLEWSEWKSKTGMGPASGC